MSFRNIKKTLDVCRNLIETRFFILSDCSSLIHSFYCRMLTLAYLFLIYLLKDIFISNLSKKHNNNK